MTSQVIHLILSCLLVMLLENPDSWGIFFTILHASIYVNPVSGFMPVALSSIYAYGSDTAVLVPVI